MSDAPARFRKRPVEIEALQWTGDNSLTMHLFAGENFDPFDFPSHVPGKTYTAQVYDKLHGTWITLSTGDWIIKGIKGEFYPCDADAFLGTYEQVEESK